ncbi:MAG: hypothetical protein ACFCUL_11445, partial [Flavobacteriaceae bacterium]
AFMIVCSFTALLYERNKADIKLLAGAALKTSWLKLSSTRATVLMLTKTWASKIMRYLERLFGLVKN